LSIITTQLSRRKEEEEEAAPPKVDKDRTRPLNNGKDVCGLGSLVCPLNCTITT